MDMFDVFVESFLRFAYDPLRDRFCAIVAWLTLIALTVILFLIGYYVILQLR